MRQEKINITEVTVYYVEKKSMFVALPVEHTFAPKENMLRASTRRLAGLNSIPKQNCEKTWG